MPETGPAAQLAQLSEEFFEVVHTTDPLSATQLGAPGFDALRACRLVVDPGMHYYGWPRAEAVDFM